MNWFEGGGERNLIFSCSNRSNRLPVAAKIITEIDPGLRFPLEWVIDVELDRGRIELNLDIEIQNQWCLHFCQSLTVPTAQNDGEEQAQDRYPDSVERGWTQDETSSRIHPSLSKRCDFVPLLVGITVSTSGSKGSSPLAIAPVKNEVTQILKNTTI